MRESRIVIREAFAPLTQAFAEKESAVAVADQNARTAWAAHPPRFPPGDAWGTRRRRSTVMESRRKYGREMQCAVFEEVQIHEVIAARHDAAEQRASRSPPLRHVALLSFDVAAGPSRPMRRVRRSRGLADRDAGIAGDLPEGVRTRLSVPRSSARPCEPEGRRERS